MSRPSPGGEINAGRLYAWWRGDKVPALPPLLGLTVARALDLAPVCQVLGIGGDEAAARVSDGNVPYLACLEDRPACVGWSAHARAHIGELARALELPADDRYLWDFLTVPALRGRGLYPRLLQAVIDMEADATRFWIGHAADNAASGKGILKAGFAVVGDVWADSDGLRLVATADADRARARVAADLLGMPLLVSARSDEGSRR